MNSDILTRLRLPLIAAPMFLGSGLDLVVAACRGGCIGAFPAANTRTPEVLHAWFDALEAMARATPDAAPFAVNLTLDRPDDDPVHAAVLARAPPIVITSVGDPSLMVRRVHDWGGLIFHDVTTVRHARKAAAAGVDGIILVCAGAGGHAGAMSPFALLPQVREFYDGLIILGGAIGTGAGILSARALGADLVYMGTRFLATRESLASAAYKAMLIEAESADVVYTPAISGLSANFLRQSILANGLDPGNLPPPKGLHHADLPAGVKAWRDVWSGGHGVGLIQDIPSVAELIERLDHEFKLARAAFIARDATVSAR